MTTKAPEPTIDRSTGPGSSESGQSEHEWMTWWNQVTCEDVAATPIARGVSEDKLVRALNHPTRHETFRMADRQDEFRIELQNTYPLSDPANRDVPIKEWTWVKPGCRLTVWLHELDQGWSVLDAVVSSDTVEF